VAFVAVFLPAGHPLQFVDGFRFLAGRSVQSYGLPIGLLYHPTVSLPAGLGLSAYGVSLVGIVVAFWRRSPTDRALLALVAAYLLLVGFSQEVFLRYALPLLPPLCLLAGRAFQPPAGRMHARMAVLAALVLAPSAAMSIQGDRLLTATDTRVEAAFWLLANAAPGSELVLPNYWGEPFYDAEAIRTRPLHPLYLAGNALPDSFQLGRFSDRFVINRAVGTHCYQVYESGPPWQAPPPTVPAGATVVATFRPYSRAAPAGNVSAPLASFSLPPPADLDSELADTARPAAELYSALLGREHQLGRGTSTRVGTGRRDQIRSTGILDRQPFGRLERAQNVPILGRTD